MSTLLVVERPEDWPLHVPQLELTSARNYLTDPRWARQRGVKVFNLCRSYRYQSIGYYVSLLAAARGHKVLPNISTTQDLKNRSLVRVISEDLDELIQRNLRSITSDQFTLSIYFGRNLAKRYESLSHQLFNLFPAPLLRARFARQGPRWQMQSVLPIAAKDIPPGHEDFVVESASEYFTRGRGFRRRPAPRYDLAILVNPAEVEPPSNRRAIRRFIKAGQSVGFRVELIEPDDIGYLAEFDALFIRETTAVNNHTYRFARRAAAEGLVVIDDADSILRCSNKVYLAELLARAGVRTPKTVVVHRANAEEVGNHLGFPCILKAPDSSFSQGVVRVEDLAAFTEKVAKLFETSELVIAQEFVPTEFDWRVGILDRQPLYVSRYYMAPGHWQIINWNGKERVRYGKVESLLVDAVPPRMVKTALKAANLVGDGFYGVDLKEYGGKFYVIEVNDNPNIEAGYEDQVLGHGLYRRIMEVFMKRVEQKKQGRVPN